MDLLVCGTFLISLFMWQYTMLALIDTDPLNGGHLLFKPQ